MAQPTRFRQQHKTQTAVLLIFPEGVSKDRADEIVRYMVRTESAHEQPRIAQVQEFIPDHGGVCIYQP
jgi:hypothetical protein